ncbi:MAG: hypothetical protein ACFFG0_06150 [Candidatus Thorarchaeota archaeon]
MSESILGYFGLVISLIALFIVFWDHWKDDRLLTKRVQGFYEDIEWLIFSNYKKIIYQIFFDTSADQIREYERENFNYRTKNYFYMGKIAQRFEDFSKYLGLTYYIGPKNYINESEYFIDRMGEIYHFYSDLSRNIGFNKRKSFYDPDLETYVIDNEAISIIETYLESLRTYWEIYYKKGKLFRRKLHPKINFLELLNII